MAKQKQITTTNNEQTLTINNPRERAEKVLVNFIKTLF